MVSPYIGFYIVQVTQVWYYTWNWLIELFLLIPSAYHKNSCLIRVELNQLLVGHLCPSIYR